MINTSTQSLQSVTSLNQKTSKHQKKKTSNSKPCQKLTLPPQKMMHQFLNHDKRVVNRNPIPIIPIQPVHPQQNLIMTTYHNHPQNQNQPQQPPQQLNDVKYLLLPQKPQQRPPRHQPKEVPQQIKKLRKPIIKLDRKRIHQLRYEHVYICICL